MPFTSLLDEIGAEEAIPDDLEDEADEAAEEDVGAEEPDPPLDPSTILNIDQNKEYDDLGTAIGEADTGDTIELGPTNFGSVTIDTEDLTLKGPNAGTSALSNDRVSEATLDTASIQAGGVTVDGVRVNGLEEASGLTNADYVVEILTEGEFGEEDDPVTDVTIQNSIIEVGPDVAGVTGNSAYLILHETDFGGQDFPPESISIANNKLTGGTPDDGDRLYYGISGGSSISVEQNEFSDLDTGIDNDVGLSIASENNFLPTSRDGDQGAPLGPETMVGVNSFGEIEPSVVSDNWWGAEAGPTKWEDDGEGGTEKTEDTDGAVARSSNDEVTVDPAGAPTQP